MPKVNVYLEDALAERVRGLRLPMSEICREALWNAVGKDTGAMCNSRGCKALADYHVRSAKGNHFVCMDHVTGYLNGVSTVRQLR